MNSRVRSNKAKRITVRSTDEIMKILRRELPRLRRDYDVRTLGLFGSYVKGSQDARSDVDLLVEYEQVPGMFKYLELENELADLLGCKVDLVLKSALKPSIRSRILQEVLTA